MKYRYVGNSGLLVSRVCLGTMTFGARGWGCDQDAANRITNRFLEAGGNFFDTADMYGTGESETMLGRALREHARDDLVIATKCMQRMREGPIGRGLSRKHILDACEASLRRLALDHVDLYQIHGPDPYTPIEETMKALDDLVRHGKVRYLGCSNLFAWHIVKANAAAERLGLEPFRCGQYMYNLIRRDIERDVLPACADQGMGVICWSPLASGLLTGKYTRADRPDEGTRIAHRADIDLPRYWHEQGFRVADAVVATAKEHGMTPARLALGWLLFDRRICAVIIGARTTEQLADTVATGDLDIAAALHERLAEVVPFNHGYPREWMDMTYPRTYQDAEFDPDNAAATPQVDR